MNSIKSKAGIVTAFLCLIVVAAVLWFVFRGRSQEHVPEGTLVEICAEEVAA